MHTVRKESYTMKKVLAIVISLIMVFSLASAAFAYEIAPGQVYFGPVSNAYANPGETTQLTVNFSADAFENDGYPTDGILHIPFMINNTDLSVAQIVGYKLTDEAVAAGVVFTEDTAIMDEGTFIIGQVDIPSALIYGNTNLNLFTIDLAVSPDWEVIDNVATENIFVEVLAGDTYIPAWVDNESEYVEVVNFVTDAFVVEASPYVPTTWEKIVEKIKGYVAAFVNILIVGLQYILNNFLQPAPWA